MNIPAMQFLTNPYTLLAGGIGTVVKLGSEAEMTAKAFKTLVGSEEKAKNMLQEIKAFADKTPFDQLHLTDVAQQMMTNLVPAEKTMTYLRQLGDISSGSKEKLSSLALVMGQVVGAGKLNGQDLTQFINAGFNPLAELQKMNPKKSYEELKTAMSKGQISAEMVASAIKHATSEGGQFYNMMESLSTTASGQWSTLVGNIQTMAVGVFEKIQPYVLEFMGLLARAIPKVSQALMFLVDLFVGGLEFIKSWKSELLLFGSIMAMLTLYVQAKTIALYAYTTAIGVVRGATMAWTAVQTALNVAISTNPIGLVIFAIGALVAAVVYCWNKFAGFRAFLITAWDTFKKLGSIIKDYVLNRINEMLEGVGKVGKALKALLSGNFSEAWSTFKDGVGNIYGKNSALKAGAQIKETVVGIKGEWQKNLSQEERKQREKERKEQTDKGITDPELKGSSPLNLAFGAGKGDGKGKGNKTGDAIVTGGARNSTINITIGKFFDAINVHMMDKADTGELERVVLEALNRSLAIATSRE